ncbi:hypothetical protein BXO88_03670 [Oribacterium sp. C9]|uniref:response regulator transcription factor n=1 Tax=Oribacterium sp. C9 TaxID=1943579 RepID=UPI00098F192D|nr:LuxR C-terminal-related transcriptional regulator [Oribacterium sp. C9]OON87383.1 hypothetical protein BXO88_03670 [Oribacterium sp. C9]
MGYIKVPKVYEKLKKAEEFFSPVIMTAATGWGKTAAAEYFYRRKNPLILRCADGRIKDTEKLDSFKGSVVIIEDLHWISEEESIRFVRKLLREKGIHVIILTRGGVPKYLAAEEMDLDFVRIQERDFAFTEKEIIQYFSERGQELCPEDVEPITRTSRGYPRAVHCYAMRMEGGYRYSDEIRNAVLQDIYHIWDGQVYEQWSDEFVQFALNVCQYDEFTVEMAEYLTGNRNILSVIEYSKKITNQLIIGTEGYYRIRPETKGYFMWKQKISWSPEDIRSNYGKAAYYYELHDDISNALKYYKKAGATDRIRELLIHNAYRHPGTGHYVETREYYLETPEENIKRSPVLMAGMSMLYDLTLRPDKSEEWYGELLKFYQNPQNSRELRREAKTRLAYLDICLPHRGSKGILRTMKNVFGLVQQGEIVLPEFTVTGNLPSIMNGSLDFCEWSKNDTQIAKFMGSALTSLFGSYGNGLITIALAESGFEKGTMSPYEVLTRCNDGYEDAAHGGKIEMCFVSVGIQVRQHLLEGQLPSAKRVYDTFCERVRNEGALHLLPNIDAFGTKLSLFGGTDGDLTRYIESVPDARVMFCTLDRYRQMIKLRCLIAVNRLQEAFDLSVFLTGYFESYERRLYYIENEILKSIVLYRMGDEHWKNHLTDALRRAGEYHFTRVVSLEGIALLPLLIKLSEDGALRDIDKSYFHTAYKECVKVAGFFPDYLKYIPKEKVSLSNRESQVLSMLCAGLSMDEICANLGISYDGLKKHNRNIYKKLGVKGRGDAERKAVKLGLVHMRGTV